MSVNSLNYVEAVSKVQSVSKYKMLLYLSRTMMCKLTKEKNKMSMSDHEGIINHCHHSSDFCGKLFKGPYGRQAKHKLQNHDF